MEVATVPIAVVQDRVTLAADFVERGVAGSRDGHSLVDTGFVAKEIQLRRRASSRHQSVNKSLEADAAHRERGLANCLEGHEIKITDNHCEDQRGETF